jgi:hypothetical protein
MNKMIPTYRGLQASVLLCIGLLLGTWPAAAQQRVLDQLTAENPANLLSNGGFEAMKPAYWQATGEGATWASDVARTPERSLALGGAGEAAWTMEEGVRNWVPGFPGTGTPEIEVGGWVWADGVNTSPGSDADKFQLVFEFFDAPGGTDVLGEPLVLDVPQTEATTGGWVELSSAALGAITLPSEQAAKSARVTFRKGSGATGTVYLDDVFIRKADPEAEGWSGDFFNANVDASDTWYYWWNNFSGGEEGWPETQPFVMTVTDAAAHTGTYSLKIEQHVADASESVGISERVAVEAGEPVLVSYWVKTEGVVNPEEIGQGDNNIGMTALWYNNLEGGAAGYGEIGGVDIRLNGEYNPQVIPLAVQASETEWTQYAFVVYPPEGAVGMELRLRYWHTFEGTTYWDDVAIAPIGGDALTGGPATDVEDETVAEVPGSYQLHQNYPNPFNPVTTIAFDLPKQGEVTLAVYNVLGQRVATLLDGARVPAGTHHVPFDASGLPSGMYVYVLEWAQGREARSMVLLK